ncbi:MaoC family dehydratase [Labrys sp. LIt4]|uniref:Dehydratase n=1 Tax=Labrys okinawensis TaxID=346911 RepID=A0A2S9QF27_9HYPH|nr:MULTISPECIES: MaoC family dehydratase [Labrys]MBP0578200.1 MaoC family dehydratase [Labrys sp. LIt4]PRH87958.1 dehydratase [Labrys okinawensis]
MKYFEDLAVGDTDEIGAFTFSAENIKRFAALYDPQPFHVDEAAAAASHFGGLVASGWQVAAVWMKLLVAHQEVEIARARQLGKPVVKLGPSPGFRNMVWARPVRAGDTLRYSVEVTGKKESASRPEWGIVSMLSSALNQHGEQAFRFEGTVFWERRG